MVISLIAITVANQLRPFQAKIVGKKHFVLGENVRFKALFKGELKHGLFTAEVHVPNGTQSWWAAYDTFQRTENGDLGILSGRKTHEAEWTQKLLTDYPTGYYTAHIKVCDRADLSSSNFAVKEKTVSFSVTPPGYLNKVLDDTGKFYKVISESGDSTRVIEPIED
jgi:hypothetical protein